MLKIDDKKECCGCEACANICPQKCIVMSTDEEGFLYPKIQDSTCIKCGLCESVCPIRKGKVQKEDFQQEAVLLQNINKKICLESTSGGAFTAIAEYVLDRGGIVFGVEMTENYFVQHIGVEKKEELNKFRNSKYVQSRVGNTYAQAKKELEKGRLVCYSGTPCQIEGLRGYLRKEYTNLILVDVVCRAVPSPGIWGDYIQLVEKKLGRLKSVRFRDKTLGYQYSTMRFENSEGKIYRGGIESQPWLRMFFSGMIIRPSCTECKFRSCHRNSDFTIWDCFNVNQIDKSFDENIGVTRMLLHSNKAKNIFDKIRVQYTYKIIAVEVAIKGVKELEQSPSFNVKRTDFFKDYKIMPLEKIIKKYYPMSLSIIIKKYVRLALNKVGLDRTIKHILKKR